MMLNIQLSDLLRTLANSLQTPVNLILILFVAVTVLLCGTLFVEFFTEQRRMKATIPQLVEQMRTETSSLESVIMESGLLKRQKTALLELTKHVELTERMREALASRLLFEEQAYYSKITKLSDLVSKLAPMFGLLGTLIPLGPGIIALGRGDTFTLSSSLLMAFDTTIAGLVSAAIAFVISAVRKHWYENNLTALEALMECVLELEKVNRFD